MSDRTEQEMIAERLRLLNKDVTALMPDRPDLLHPANEALNKMVLLQDAIIKNLPK